MLFTTACTTVEDKDPAPRRTAPTTDFIGGAGYINTNATVAVNQSFKVKYQIAKGSSGLTQIRYSQKKLSGSAPFADNIFALNSGAGDIQSPQTDENTYSLGSAGQLQFKVFANDLNSLADSAVIVVTVQ